LRELLGESRLDVLANSSERLVPLRLLLQVERLSDLRLRKLSHATLDLLRNLLLHPLHLREGDVLEELLLDVDQLPDRLVRNDQRLRDLLLGNLDRAALDHRDRALRPRHHDVHVAELELLERRVDHPLPLDPADPDRGDRTREGDLRHVQRGRAPQVPVHIRVVLLVRAEHVDEQLRLVEETFGEERTARTVDLPRREDLLLARTTLTLDEATRDLPGSVALLPVLHRQGEERKR